MPTCAMVVNFLRHRRLFFNVTTVKLIAYIVVTVELALTSVGVLLIDKRPEGFWHVIAMQIVDALVCACLIYGLAVGKPKFIAAYLVHNVFDTVYVTLYIIPVGFLGYIAASCARIRSSQTNQLHCYASIGQFVVEIYYRAMIASIVYLCVAVIAWLLVFAAYGVVKEETNAQPKAGRITAAAKKEDSVWSTTASPSENDASSTARLAPDDVGIEV